MEVWIATAIVIAPTKEPPRKATIAAVWKVMIPKVEKGTECAAWITKAVKVRIPTISAIGKAMGNGSNSYGGNSSNSGSLDCTGSGNR